MFRSVLFSILLHATLFLLGVLWHSEQDPAHQDLLEKKEKQKGVTWIELDSPPVKKRVVQTNDELDDRVPTENAYLGERNQTVKKQAVSRNAKSFPESGSNLRHAQSSTTSHLGKEKTQTVSLSNLALPLDQPSKQNSEQGGAKELLPLPEGAETTLNTREFKFYSYYQRIRNQLEVSWTPLLRQKIADLYSSGRKIAIDHEHTTRLIVVLNRSGEIIRIQMIEESGTLALDQSAVEAFNEAGPFPNPPHGMIESTEEVHIPWDFVLKT